LNSVVFEVAPGNPTAAAIILAAFCVLLVALLFRKSLTGIIEKAAHRGIRLALPRRVGEDMRVVVAITTSSSLVHLQSAKHLLSHAKSLDDAEKYLAAPDPERSRIANELIATSFGATVASYFAVEAIVNELFIEHEIFPSGHWFPGLDRSLASRLNQAWELSFRKLSPMEKCDMALLLAQKSPLNWGRDAAQRFLLLHELRNALAHAKPESFEHGKNPTESDDRLERKLCTQFPPSTIYGRSKVAFRWGGCLGKGCALWAYQTALDFQQEFFSALGTDYPCPG
jgi:hypothetical protein